MFSVARMCSLTGNSILGKRNSMRLQGGPGGVDIRKKNIIQGKKFLPGTLFVANGIACASKVAMAALISVTVSAV
jgi:hypothetical protein